jgi:tripartite motif-containing protein 2/3/tripartite motif-containing protein 71
MYCSFLSSNQTSLSNQNDYDLHKKRKHQTFNCLGVGKKGKGDNSFCAPFSCTLSSDHIFVADYGNHRIQVFSKDTLTYIKTIGGSSSTIHTESNLNHPISICYNDRLDYIYVADYYHHRIQIYNAESGDWIRSIGDNGGRSGKSNNSFHSPQGVCIDCNLDRLYIADTGNNRIQVYNSVSCEYLFSIGVSGKSGFSNALFDSPGAVCIDYVSQNLYVSDWNNERVQIFSANTGKWIRTIGTTGEDGTSNKHLSGPYGVSIDFISNLVYIVDSLNNRVQVFNKGDGEYVRSISIEDNEVVKSNNGSVNTAGGLFQAREVCVDQKTGRLYIVDRGNHRILIDFTYQRNSFIKKSTCNFTQPSLYNSLEKIVNTYQCADIILLVEGERLPAHKVRYFLVIIYIFYLI